MYRKHFKANNYFLSFVLCSGQSNMELSMYYTFSRNLTKDAIAAGQYNNIRMMTFGHNPQPAPTFVVNESLWGSVKGSSNPGYVWITAKEAALTPYPRKKNSWGTCKRNSTRPT